MSVDALLSPPPAATEAWQGTLDGLAVGPGTPYGWRLRNGFKSLPPVRVQDEARPWAHGTWDAPDWADGRTFTLSWKVRATDSMSYGAALDALERVMVPGRVVTLWVRLPRQGLLRWHVKVRRFEIPVDAVFDVDLVTDAACQLYAADPVGYGPGQSASTGFGDSSGSGLQFDLFTDGEDMVTGFLEFGQPASSGRLSLSNPGTAETWPVYEVSGPTANEGFEIVDVPTGRRIRFEGYVPFGSTLTIDTGDGSVLLDDVADRSGLLTLREWSPIPAGGSTEVQFLTLGSPTPATLRAVYAPGWW
ncbi:hypothetical protein UQW22_09860 [Isoptericola halotolerans]|uniref:phage distal tail protein n=1 Tax=Isoptericola halotolerans TaxID=300560 RepID=UPI00388F2DE3